MFGLVRLFSILVALSCVTAAADAIPAPQSFRQEMAHHREWTNGLPEGPVQFVEIAPDGTPWVFSSGTWFNYRHERWERLGETTKKSDRFVLPDLGGHPLELNVPAQDVIQLLRNGATNYVATKRDLLVVAQGIQCRSVCWR